MSTLSSKIKPYFADKYHPYVEDWCNNHEQHCIQTQRSVCDQTAVVNFIKGELADQLEQDELEIQL